MTTFERQRTKLRGWLVVIVAALAIPSAVLLWHSYNQLQYEAFYSQRSIAVAMASEAQRHIEDWISAEENRPTTDYDFLVISGEEYVQRSPLSSLSPTTAIPGIVGFFQVDAAGGFATPLLPKNDYEPADYKLSDTEHEERLAKQDAIRELLQTTAQPQPLPQLDDLDERDDSPMLAESAAVPAPALEQLRPATASPEALEDIALRSLADSPAGVGVERDETGLGSTIRAELTVPAETRERSTLIESNQRIFQQLSSLSSKEQKLAVADASAPKVADLNLKERFVAEEEAQSEKPEPAYFKKLEKSRAVTSPVQPITQIDTRQITTFDSAVDPFRMDRLDRFHWVFFRNVWREEQRFVQGFVVEAEAFLNALVGNTFASSSLAANTNLVVALDGNIVELFPSRSAGEYALAPALEGDVLLNTRLPGPMSGLELLFSVTTLPTGAGSTTLMWVGSLLLAVFTLGFWWIHRLGVQQIALAEQQQDFVSSVSHELKTPLTSIRMYGEMLKAGWTDESKRQSYYDQIFNESERLTRLINNLLSLARISHEQTSTVETQSVQLHQLLTTADSLIATTLEHSGFELTRKYDESLADAAVTADPDAFSQVVINLVDNAVKFSQGQAANVEIGTRSRGAFVEVWIRDFGPGIEPDQLKKIFSMFYRVENELTRETTGTGIGLALVSELVQQMGGEIDVVNCEPGAEFRVRLKRAD